MSAKKTLFISDLHLSEQHPEMTAAFLSLLAQNDPNREALYILGDLFDAWIGDDDLSPYHLKIMQALKQAVDNGLPIYFLCGNRDFLIGKKFLQATGCIELPEEKLISLYGQPTLLMHGDTLCTRDIQYLRARKILRNKFLQTLLFLWLPLSVRRKMAEKMRNKSQQHTKYASMEQMDVTQDEVERLMRKYQVSKLIHGHTHKPCLHQFELDGKPVTRLVLGAWHDKTSVLVCDDEGKCWLE